MPSNTRRPPNASARIRFTPAILPPYARRSKSLDTLIPILYLKGVSTGDFAPALAALLGKDGPGLSAATIARLKDVWFDEHKRWSERDLSAKSYVYVWADGVYLQARLEDEAQCILVIIGVRRSFKKDRDPLLAFYDFPAEHWKHLRTSNPIESTFATVRHRTIRSKGCLSNKDRARHGLQVGRGRADDLASP